MAIDAFIFQLVVLGLGLPLLVVALILAVGWRMWKPSVERHSDPTIASWALALGLSVSVVAIQGWPPVPAVVTNDWLLWIVLAAGLIGGITGWWQRRAFISTPLRMVAVGVVVYLTAGPLIQGADAIWWVGGLMLAIALVWLLIDFQSRGLPEPLSVFSLATAAGFGGMAVLLGGTAKLGQIGGVLGLAMGLLFLALALFPAKKATGAPATFHALVTSCLLLNGVWYAVYVPLWAAALVFVSPLAASVYFLPGIKHLPWWLRWGVAMLAVLILAGIGAAVCNFPPEAPVDESHGYGY